MVILAIVLLDTMKIIHYNLKNAFSALLDAEVAHSKVVLIAYQDIILTQLISNVYHVHSGAIVVQIHKYVKFAKPLNLY